MASRRALFTLVVISILLLGLVIAPLAKAFFLAAVLAGALYPLVTFLSRRMRNKRSLAAGMTLVGVLLLILGPVTGFTAFAISEGSKAAVFVTRTIRSEGVTGLVDRLPERLRGSARWGIDRLPVDAEALSAQFNEQIGAQGGKAAAAVSGALSATGAFVFQSVMMLIALYALLVQGGRLMVWLEQISPLGEGQFTELFVEFRRTSVAVMLSSAATAAVQSLVAMIGYFIAGVPHPLFFTALTFFIAFVPAVGAAGVCLAAALLLFGTGHLFGAIFLAAWGLLVVGLVDNILKPIFVKRGMDLNGVVIFFSLIGGIAAFGPLGLLLGPLAVAFFLAVVRIWHRSYGGGHAKAAAVAEATQPGP